MDHVLDDLPITLKGVAVSALIFLKTVNVVTDYGKDIQHFNVKNIISAFVDHLLDDFPSL